MFERILVPLDGSPLAERAIPVAARIARATKGTVLLLLRVIGIPIQYGPYLYSSYISQTPFLAQEILDAEQVKAEYYLANIARSEYLLESNIETKAITGAAAGTILETANLEHADLVVICSHGRTGFKRWALGSVAQKVARHSPVQVLLLRVGNPESVDLPADRVHALRALVALDGSPFAEAALMPAAQLIAALASPRPGALHLTRVVELPTSMDEEEYQQGGSDTREEALRQAAQYLSEVTERLEKELTAEHHGLVITWSVAMNEDVADELIRIAELGEDTGTFEVQGCDLIAMATHGRGGLQRWMMGSTTERVLDGTKLPLLIVRPKAVQAPIISEPTQA